MVCVVCFIVHLACALVALSSREALKSVSFIQTRAKKQTARFTGYVEIGSKLKISCKMYTKVGVVLGCRAL